MADRMKLTVTEVKPVQEVGAKKTPKLTFRAKDPEGKELTYFTFGQSFFSHIVQDATIDVDVETSEREYDGNTYTDRKVTQVYVDGQPQKRGFGRPDTASIESQVAAKIGAELLIAGIIDKDSKLGVQVIQWCESRLESKSPPKAEPLPQPSEGAKPADNPETKDERDLTPLTKQEIADLKKMLADNDISLTSFGKWLRDKGWQVSKFEELTRWHLSQIMAAFAKGKE